MKTFLSRSKSSLILLALLATAAAQAKPIAQVTTVSGNVFVITPDGQTTSLKVNDHLELKSEVMVDEGGSITLNDYYDATYHLTGGSHVKFFDKSVQLKRGKTWIQSTSSRYPLALTTANGHAAFGKGEFITTFDQLSSRSQVLVVNGDVEVSNILDKDMKQTISAGSFTIVDPEVDNGSPRAPTKVGLSSLNGALAEFKQVPATVVAPARAIASVEENEVRKGEIIFIKSSRMPASVKGSAHTYYKQKLPAKKHQASHAPIRFFGVTMAPQAAPILVAPRAPASIGRVVLAQKTASMWKIDQEFGDTLKKEVAAQPKHSKELDSLIEELKSY